MTKKDTTTKGKGGSSKKSGAKTAASGAKRRRSTMRELELSFIKRRCSVKGTYRPTSYKDDELATLREIGMVGGRPRADVAHGEVARVAHNIAVTLSDPDTPEKVREAVKSYALRVCHWTLQDFEEIPAAVLALFPVACVAISSIPFVPNKPYIEALTGTDRKAALAAARKSVDI